MLLMREESFGPIIGIQKVKDDDEALALMNDTALRPHRRRVHPGRGAGREAAGAGERRQRLLELLRPRQPAPAVVGRTAFRRRRDAVALRHPDLHAAEGLAPAQALNRLALFDLDGTLLDGDTDELWCEFLMDEGVLDRADFEARNRSIVERYRAGSGHAGRVLRLLRVDAGGALARRLAGRCAAASSQTQILPRIGGAARALVAGHRDAGDRVLLTTATNRFLTEPIAPYAGDRRARPDRHRARGSRAASSPAPTSVS